MDPQVHHGVDVELANVCRREGVGACVGANVRGDSLLLVAVIYLVNDEARASGHWRVNRRRRAVTVDLAEQGGIRDTPGRSSSSRRQDVSTRTLRSSLPLSTQAACRAVDAAEGGELAVRTL